MDFQKIVGRVLDKYSKFEDNVRYQQEKKLQEYESKVNEYEIKVNSSNNRSLQDIKEAKEKIDKAREAIELQKKGRRTDEEAAKLPTNWNSRNATEADCKYNVKLSDLSAYGNKPGVYILYCDGCMMKVGSAEIGVRKRLQQYYGMNKSCGLPYITKENREKLSASWQECPVGKCNELESKLYKKYGKGPWAKRTPHSNANTWKLLI